MRSKHIISFIISSFLAFPRYAYGYVRLGKLKNHSGSMKVPQNVNSQVAVNMIIDAKVLGLLGSAVSVASVIAFHEAGHFLAAKWQNMKVQSYNIGYGPKIIAFNDSSDTEFALRALPLGGYVAFPANVEVDDDGEVTKELDDPDLLQNRPPLQRALVISAGVIANIILSIILASGASFTTGINRPVFAPGTYLSIHPLVLFPS